MTLSALCSGKSRLWKLSLLLAGGGWFAAIAMAGTPGLNGPVEIGAFLNHSLPEVEPTGASEWTVEETYKGININLPMHLTPYPGTRQLLCVAKEGRIFLFDDDPAATQTSTFLDLGSQVFTSSDSGMTYLVFHPDFGKAGSPNRDFVYVTYKWKPSGGNGNEAYWRLSRFTVITQNGKPVANPASEQILIQQYDRQQWHDSGCMTFGADGYLYVGIGDEGGSNDQYNDGQKIDDRLFSGILRIDVDEKAANHAIRRQPQQLPMPGGWPASFTAHYRIPADNPFNHTAGANLEEFYAIGVRQPYRFSQDPVTGLIWLAESGQDSREELDIVKPGANFGWPFREGKIARPTGPQPPVIPNPILGTLTEPIWDATHVTDACTIGGFVYRGAAHAALVGKFITVDNVTGHIRAHTYDGKVATNELLTDMPSGSVYSGTSTIGRDQAGEPVFVKINGTGTRGRFFRLASIPAPVTHAAWFRFEDRAAANASGDVSENPGHATANSLAGGVPLVAPDDGNGSSANVTYIAGSGVNPAGFPANFAAVRISAGQGGVRPGNAAGELATGSRLGVLDDFTIELSFRPNAGSLDAGYQAFLGLHGTTGIAPGDGEAGPPLQPFRLMRWGRNDATATTLPLQDGDLFLNVRTMDPKTAAWTSVPVRVFAKSGFTADRWYHLAIVGNVANGTVTVFSFSPATGEYLQIGQGTGYAGNLQAGVWTVGRGAYNGAAADWVADANFDEVRISPEALPTAKFLYGTAPYLPAIPVVDMPPLLSQTGAFSDLATLTPAPGVVPYGVNAPLWSDRAAKLRWIAVPNDGLHDTAAEKIAFEPESTWRFPVGTVFIKHFELPVDDANPSVHRRLETRFIVMPTVGEPYGVTYKWRADGSDADLLPDGLNEEIEVATAGGGLRKETWSYPSRSECRVCHNGNAGYVLGFKTQQLNGNFTYPLTGRTANQLETLGSLGWFDGGYRSDLVPWMLRGHNVAETSAALTDRVRSYLDSNCSQCHQPGGVRAFFDARLTTRLEEQGLVNGELETNYGDDANRVIRPGDPARSILLRRLGSVAEIKMPPIAKHLVDQSAVQLVTDWINSLTVVPAVVLSTPSSATNPLLVTVHFSEPVSGLSGDDFQISGGSAGGLTGEGADYVLSVVPSGFGRVKVNLPAGSAVNAGGVGNDASRTFSQLVADERFVSWLTLDDGAGTVARDSSVSGTHHGTLIGMGARNWVAGKFGGGLAFDATDQRVAIDNPLAADFSISFWMKTTQLFPLTDGPPAGAAIFNADLPGGADDFMIAGTRSAGGVNRISFQTGTAGAANRILHGTAAVNGGEWLHVAVTRVRASGLMKIFINGVLDSSMTGSTGLLNGNSILTIGATPGLADRSYEGALDEIRLYSRSLTQAEITALAVGPEADPPYDQWVNSWLPGIYHLQGSNQDPEGDGLTNFAEFAFGGDPLVFDTVPVPLNRAEDGSVTVRYRARKTPSDAGYTVLISADLSRWNDAAPDITGITAEDIPGTDYRWITLTYDPPPEAGSSCFFRIQAKAR